MKKTVLITGANRGIGLALCNIYLASDFHVIAVCRQSSQALESIPVEIIQGIDVSESESIKHLRQSVQNRGIDIVINNAGILRRSSISDFNFDDALNMFQVNSLGPLRIVDAVLPALKKGSKIALITSRMGSVADNSSGGSYGYRMSKSALNAAGRSLAIDLRASGISVAILHPGYVSTEMVNWGGEVSPESAAQRLFERIEGLTPENTGTFWHANGEILPW
ncbi:SDR family oxidoreductase [Aliikangiella maris]|uniref:SDR family oxidoreductase n=2 Tax=Aliikangiella maris TaxID=3162458 RepID=A0ABV3MPR8_9GAMM